MALPVVLRYLCRDLALLAPLGTSAGTPFALVCLLIQRGLCPSERLSSTFGCCVTWRFLFAIICLQAMWEMGTDGPELPLGLLKIKSLCTTIPVSPVQQQIDKHRLKQVTSKCSRRDSSSSPQVFAVSKHLLASSSSVNNLKPCRYPDLIQKLTFSKHLTQN